MLNNRQSGRRRGRGRNPSGGNQRDNQSRIDNRARGNAPQMHEKFKNMAREAQMQGDRVMTEYYLQFADHYFRIIAENKARFEESRPPRREDGQGEEGYDAGNGYYNGGSDVGDHAEQSADDMSEEQPREVRQPRRNSERNAPRRDRNNGGNSYNRDDESTPVAEPAGLSIDILPPALGVTADPLPDIDEAPTPRRRGRPKREETADVVG